MACFSDLAKQLGPGCDTMIKSGWTGKARLYQYSRGGISVQYKTGNPARIADILPQTGELVQKYNVSMIDAFTGTSVAGNADNGRVAFTKTISLQIPKQSIADDAENHVDPLALDAEGYLVVLERRDGAWIVFGAYDSCTADLSSFSQNEYENGGAYVLNLTCTERVAEVYYTGSTSGW